MTKCLRALPQAMAAEYGVAGDLFLSTPHELMTVPLHNCAESDNPACQCRRIFVGISSGNPATMARVCVATTAEIENECCCSESLIVAKPDLMQDDAIGLLDFPALAHVLCNFAVGAVVRVDRINDAVCIYDACDVQDAKDQESRICA